MATKTRNVLLILLVVVCFQGESLGQSGGRPTGRQPQVRQKPKLGIVGRQAPRWKTTAWLQIPKEENLQTAATRSSDVAKRSSSSGEKRKLDIGDFRGKVVYLYFFQSWCPGCHEYGFPTLKKVHQELEENENVAFVAIQTTFEGHSINTADKLAEVAKRHKLVIPFGQSAGTSGTPDIMKRYRTGGTPWVVVIDQKGRVVFNDYKIDPKKAVAGIRQLLKTNKSNTNKTG